MSKTHQLPTVCSNANDRRKIVLAPYEWSADSLAYRVYQHVRPMVVQIKHKDGLASGFFLNRERTFIATAHHVHAANGEYEIHTADGWILGARKVCFIDSWIDIAILHVPHWVESENEWTLPSLRWGNIRRYTEVFAIGHPLGEAKAHISIGSVWEDGPNYLKLNLLTRPGLSGAPVFDACGVVLGVLTRGGEPGQLATGTSSRLLWNLYEKTVEHLQLGSAKAG